MRSFTSVVAAVAAVLPFGFANLQPSHKSNDMNPSSYKSVRVLQTDVVVVGGGGVGTYAAIQLEDIGKKIVVIESKIRLGGHTETFIDPESKLPVDVGVKLYHDKPIVHEWFTRFNLSTTRFNVSAAAAVSQNVDFWTGQVLKGIPAANQTALAAALQRYAAVLQKYPQLECGFYLPDPVPEDLYMPFGQFVQKYDIADAVQFIFGLTSAFGDILELPTLQQFRTLSLGLMATTSNFQTSSVMDNSLLFEKATAELLAADSLLLSSKVLATERVNDSGAVKILIDTPKGRTLVIAKKLLMTTPPVSSALTKFDTNRDELSIFGQFQAVGYYTSIIRNAGPVNITFQNLALDKPYALAPMPAIYNVNPIGVNPSLSLLYYGTKVGQVISDEQAKANIIADLKRYQAANCMADTNPEFVAFSNHSPYNMLVGSEATTKGFYKQLYALQGKRNTFWSGAAWRAHDSSSSWAFTKNSVLPALVASLGSSESEWGLMSSTSALWVAVFVRGTVSAN
ncbi:hypothetical protein EK21DRAFT_106835 [Setomelanomma holmii]|uniref:Amine oxidase domain-containing protein n=1 Tax=Setomelanomma holmii TaxID=210430 RepID=A0A9P4LQB7_9PLEO|nr:hypothetical protein EK21DRAFT_106835 [Setomelanomma holmii]